MNIKRDQAVFAKLLTRNSSPLSCQTRGQQYEEVVGSSFTVSHMKIQVQLISSVDEIIRSFKERYITSGDFAEKLVDANTGKILISENGVKFIHARTELELPPLNLGRTGLYYTSGYESFMDVFQQYHYHYGFANLAALTKANSEYFSGGREKLNFWAPLPSGTLLRLYTQDDFLKAMNSPGRDLLSGRDVSVCL